MKINLENNKFAFIVHARDFTDVYRKYPIAKKIPKKIVEIWCLRWPPILISKIKYKQENNCVSEGFLIALPMTAKQMMEKRELAKKRVWQAVIKAEKLGASVVSFGALTSSVTWGGKVFKKKLKIKITSGHAYTAYIVTSYVLKAIKDFDLGDNPKIGIVGAAGSVGSTCAQVISSKGYNNLLLVDIEKKIEKLNKAKNILKNDNIRITHKINDVKDCDIVIAATNSPEALIKPEDLKYGAIIIDDAQPSDISPEVAKQRDDVLIVDAGVLNAPGIELNFNLGLKNREDIFSCLGEAIIFSTNKIFFEYEIMKVSNDVINDIGNLGKSIGFSANKYQHQGKEYSSDELNKIKSIIKENKKWMQ